MKRDQLRGSVERDDADPSDPRAMAHRKAQEQRRFTETELVGVFILVILALYLGDLLGGFLARFGLIFPRFLSAMIAGIALSIAMELTKLEVDRVLVDKVGTICLNIFIVMTLSSLDLAKLQGAVGSVLVVAAAQTISTVVLVHLLVYRWRGKSYEALGIAGGFLAFLLGSFAVAMATVQNTESRYGPIHRAVLLVTLIGGAVGNVLNALVTLAFFKLLA
jgi:ESS family glutamate:Na+ symporter